MKTLRLSGQKWLESWALSASTPTTSKERPRIRMVCPTPGLLPNRFRATSVPTNATRRRRSTSSALMNRPSPGISDRMTPYSGATPRTPADVARFPKVSGRVSKISGLTSLAGPRVLNSSMSASFRSTRLPAHSPPACKLVWPPYITATPFENALLKPKKAPAGSRSHTPSVT